MTMIIRRHERVYIHLRFATYGTHIVNKLTNNQVTLATEQQDKSTYIDYLQETSFECIVH